MSRRKIRTGKYHLLAKKKQGPIRARRWSNWKKSHKAIRRLSPAQNHKCAYCGIVTWSEAYGETGPTKQMATIEHFHPLSLGGTNHDDNLVMACSRCNQERGVKPALLYFYMKRTMRGIKLERAKDRLHYRPGVLHIGSRIDETFSRIELELIRENFVPPKGQPKWNGGKPIWWNREMRYVEHPAGARPWYVPWDRARKNLRRQQNQEVT